MSPRKSYQDIAYKYLLEEIISMRLPPNMPIIEQDIAYKLNISRTPVREALKLLESTGLVVRYISQGTFVSAVSITDIEEVCDLRTALELYALEKSIYRITEDEISKVEQQFIESMESVRQGSPQLFQAADAALHDLIVAKVGSVRLKFMVDNLKIQVARFRVSVTNVYTNWEQSYREHMDIIKYIRNKDLISAKESLSHHLMYVKRRYVEIWKHTIINNSNGIYGQGNKSLDGYLYNKGE